MLWLLYLAAVLLAHPLGRETSSSRSNPGTITTCSGAAADLREPSATVRGCPPKSGTVVAQLDTHQPRCCASMRTTGAAVAQVCRAGQPWPRDHSRLTTVKEVAVLRCCTDGRGARRGLLQARPLRKHSAVNATLQARVLELWAEGKKILAIRLVQEQAGLGLQSARDYCEALAARRTPPRPRLPGGSLANQVRLALRVHDEDFTVQLVITETGMTRDEALRFISALD